MGRSQAPPGPLERQARHGAVMGKGDRRCAGLAQHVSRFANRCGDQLAACGNRIDPAIAKLGPLTHHAIGRDHTNPAIIPAGD